jgi:hypothetical protein
MDQRSLSEETKKHGNTNTPSTSVEGVRGLDLQKEHLNEQ